MACQVQAFGSLTQKQDCEITTAAYSAAGQEEIK